MASPVHALIGPTASGKEAAAVEVARLLRAEILSLDSMKVYRGMDLGTAKAPAALRAEIRHHLVDLADPSESFSARRWLTAAEAALTEVETRGALPLFVGGTALYLKSLLHGLFEGPAARPELRTRLKKLPPGELWERLSSVDPDTAARVHPNDVRRVVRALEVFEVTGTPASTLRRQWESPRRPSRLVGIRRTREDLYHRIEKRVDHMVESGLVDEVRGLLGRMGPVARQALGYKEIADHLEGAIDTLPLAVLLLKRRTRTFARRQLTWFKHFDVRWVDVAPDEPPASIAPRVAHEFS